MRDHAWLLLPLLACRPDPATEPGAAPITWSQADSPILLTEDQLIPAGETLRIDPGVRVQLAAGVSLIVQGELIARGTAVEPITFTRSEADTQWGSIHFEDSAVDAQFVDLDDYVAGSIIEHALIEHGQRAVRLDAAAPYIHQTSFRDNSIPADVDVNGGAALQINDGSQARIRACTFERNTAELFAFGGAVSVYHADPILQDNIFRNNWATYGGGLATDRMASPIVGNTFEANESISEGGGFSLISTISAVLGNTIQDNHAVGDGGGVHVCVTCYPHSAPFIMDNTITGNTSEEGATHGAAGIGVAYLKLMRDNNIHDNQGPEGASDFGWYHALSEGYPDWVSHPSIADNWWGSTDPGFIAQTIHDGSDDPELGAVRWDPIRDSAVSEPSTRVTITARKLAYVDIGDDMSVFLTLYNPGPERSIHLEIGRARGADLQPWDGALELSGAHETTAGWELLLPENSVSFTRIEDEIYAGDDGTGGGYWRAAIFDATTGSAIGVESVSPFDYATP